MRLPTFSWHHSSSLWLTLRLVRHPCARLCRARNLQRIICVAIILHAVTLHHVAIAARRYNFIIIHVADICTLKKLQLRITNTQFSAVGLGVLVACAFRWSQHLALVSGGRGLHRGAFWGVPLCSLSFLPCIGLRTISFFDEAVSFLSFLHVGDTTCSTH